ncbi:MAG: alpha/beta hydrolase [Myxococcota bacterium]
MIVFTFLGCGPAADQYFLRHDGADLRVRVEGNADSGEYILLLHGGPGRDSEWYNIGAWSERMESEVAMVYTDQRGQGASHGIYDETDLTLEQLADDTAAVIRSLHLRYGEDIHLSVMGHSWGGMLGIQALLQPDTQDDVDRWIEVDGAHDVFLLNQLAVPMFLDVGEQEIAAGRNRNEWRDIVRFAEGVNVDEISAGQSAEINRLGFEAERLIDRVSLDPEIRLLDVVDYYVASPISWPTAATVGRQTNEALSAQIELTALSPRLDEIEIPTLLLWGAYDFVVPPGVGTDAASRMPDAALVVLPDSGHTPMFNQPAAFADAVLDFIDENQK